MSEARSRRLFGVATLSALAAGTLCAVAGTRAAVSVDAEGESAAMVTAGSAQGDALTMPLVTSLALVALAAWGVLLVTRGLVRRSSAALALLAGAGALAATVAAYGSIRDSVDQSLAQVGATGTAGVTGWYIAAVVGAVDLTLSSALAVWRVPTWPEMGRRYDAPAVGTGTTGITSTGTTTGSSEPLDLWKAMDEGRDPTDRDAP